MNNPNYFRPPDPDMRDYYRRMQNDAQRTAGEQLNRVMSQASSLPNRNFALSNYLLYARNPTIRPIDLQQRVTGEAQARQKSAWERGNGRAMFGRRPVLGPNDTFPMSPARVAQLATQEANRREYVRYQAPTSIPIPTPRPERPGFGRDPHPRPRVVGEVVETLRAEDPMVQEMFRRFEEGLRSRGPLPPETEQKVRKQFESCLPALRRFAGEIRRVDQEFDQSFQEGRGDPYRLAADLTGIFRRFIAVLPPDVRGLAERFEPETFPIAPGITLQWNPATQEFTVLEGARQTPHPSEPRLRGLPNAPRRPRVRNPDYVPPSTPLGMTMPPRGMAGELPPRTRGAGRTRPGPIGRAPADAAYQQRTPSQPRVTPDAARSAPTPSRSAPTPSRDAARTKADTDRERNAKDLKQSREELQRLSSRVKSLQERLGKTRNQRAEIQKRIQQWTEEIKKLQGTRAGILKQLQGLQADLKAAGSGTDAAEKIEKTIDALTVQVQETLKDVGRLEKLIKALTNQVETLDTTAKGLEEEIKKIRSA